MAIELNVSNVKTSLSSGIGLSEGQNAQGSGKLGPLLGGKSLSVTFGTTDLQALVAKLKNEQSNAKTALLLSTLSQISDSLTDVQKRAVERGLDLTGNLASLEDELKDLDSTLAQAEADAAVLQMQIDSLQKQIDDAVEAGEDHNKLVEKQKEVRAELDEKERVVSETTDEINQVTNQIASVKGQIAGEVKVIGENTLKTIAADISRSYSSDESESDSEVRKQERKEEASDIFASIRDSLDKIERDLEETIEGGRPSMA